MAADGGRETYQALADKVMAAIAGLPTAGARDEDLPRSLPRFALAKA